MTGELRAKKWENLQKSWSAAFYNAAGYIWAVCAKSPKPQKQPYGYFEAAPWLQYYVCRDKSGSEEVLSFYSVARNSNLKDFPRDKTNYGPKAEWVVQSTIQTEELLMLRGFLNKSQAQFLEDFGAKAVSLEAYVQKLPSAFGEVNPAPVGTPIYPYLNFNAPSP